jgi:glycosidase
MIHLSHSLLPLFTLMLILLSGCGEAPEANQEATDKQQSMTTSEMDWLKDAVIYEVNVRQYTPEGTFAAFREHLPRLKELGVDILWFMPIYPISETNRKGTLGSYYAISDYTAINPEFGTLEEFKALTEEIQGMGMKVVLDWVANHTGWDHAWIKDHPDWYTKNDKGEITDPIGEDGKPWGWTDVADLDYNQEAMRQAMIDEMIFWVSEVGVDGFRCDVAGEVPDDFWVNATSQLRAVQPVFMLAEAEHPPHRNNGSFHASYGWSFHHLMNQIAQGEEEATVIQKWLKKDRKQFKKGFHMQFITNHDENSWNGTVEERMGPAGDVMAVLSFTMEGMPLIYSGQEAGLNKRLEFFEKDSIDWSDLTQTQFYQTLTQLKTDNEALWNGEAGGPMAVIETNLPKDVFAFSRQKGENEVVVILNLSETPQNVEFVDFEGLGDYNNVFANTSLTLSEDTVIPLSPWGYLVLSR